MAYAQGSGDPLVAVEEVLPGLSDPCMLLVGTARELNVCHICAMLWRHLHV